jgi:hypothetical protein
MKEIKLHMGVRRNEGKERRKKDNVTCCTDDEPVVESCTWLSTARKNFSRPPECESIVSFVADRPRIAYNSLTIENDRLFSLLIGAISRGDPPRTWESFDGAG